MSGSSEYYYFGNSTASTTMTWRFENGNWTLEYAGAMHISSELSIGWLDQRGSVRYDEACGVASDLFGNVYVAGSVGGSVGGHDYYGMHMYIV